jgi:hypothetical protein
MLQPSDAPWIERAIGPYPYKLENGRLTVLPPTGLQTETRDENGVVKRAPYVYPHSQEEIEAKVRAYKLLDHRSSIAVHFANHLRLLDAVLFDGSEASLSLTENGKSADPEIDLWVQWRKAVFKQFDAAKVPKDVLLPNLPPVPSRHVHSDRLKRRLKEISADEK